MHAVIDDIIRERREAVLAAAASQPIQKVRAFVGTCALCGWRSRPHLDSEDVLSALERHELRAHA